MPASGRVEFIDRVNTQKPDQRAQSGAATQKPNQTPAQPRYTITWQTDGTYVKT